MFSMFFLFAESPLAKRRLGWILIDLVISVQCDKLKHLDAYMLQNIFRCSVIVLYFPNAWDQCYFIHQRGQSSKRHFSRSVWLVMMLCIVGFGIPYLSGCLNDTGNPMHLWCSINSWLIHLAISKHNMFFYNWCWLKCICIII